MEECAIWSGGRRLSGKVRSEASESQQKGEERRREGGAGGLGWWAGPCGKSPGVRLRGTQGSASPSLFSRTDWMVERVLFCSSLCSA